MITIYIINFKHQYNLQPCHQVLCQFRFHLVADNELIVDTPRPSTFFLQLNNVTKGGATIFLDLNITVFPVKVRIILTIA